MEEYKLPLVAGGLFDQPEPLFSLVRQAGYVYEKRKYTEDEYQAAKAEAASSLLDSLVKYVPSLT